MSSQLFILRRSIKINTSHRTLKAGDPVTYNGTDFLILNTETGLIEEVDSAQDLITLFHNLGLTGITV